MIKKEKYIESPIKTFKLKDLPSWQKRNGNTLCKIVVGRPNDYSYHTKSYDYTLYVLKGSIKYQPIYDDTIEYCKDIALNIEVQESVFLPKGSYHYWVGSEGVEYVIVMNNPPHELFDAIHGENINL